MMSRGPRRRTPGLHREEVAQLSAVGVTWYTWIEQGRAAHVSAQVLDAVDLIAKYRAGMAEHVAEPAWKQQLNRLLRASGEFRELWERHEVAPMSPHVKRYRHPRVGLIRLEHRNMWPAPQSPAHRVVAYLPADEESEERLERLAELPDERPAG